MDLTARFLNLSGTYSNFFYFILDVINFFKIYQGPTYKVFKFIRDQPTRFLDLLGTNQQSF